MTRKLFATAALATALGLSAAATASAAGVTISCARGPLPHVSIINGPSKQFIRSIEANYQVTPDEARAAATYVCADMTAVGNAERLRARTRTALSNYKRR